MQTEQKIFFRPVLFVSPLCACPMRKISLATSKKREWKSGLMWVCEIMCRVFSKVGTLIGNMGSIISSVGEVQKRGWLSTVMWEGITINLSMFTIKGIQLLLYLKLLMIVSHIYHEALHIY